MACVVGIYSLNRGQLAKYALNQRTKMLGVFRKDARNRGISQNVGPPVDLATSTDSLRAVSLEAPSENAAEALMCSHI